MLGLYGVPQINQEKFEKPFDFLAVEGQTNETQAQNPYLVP
jgi:hypothetical protein